MDFTFPQIAAAIFLFCFLSGCATTTPPEGFYQGETPYTMETDTMKRLELIPELGQPQITIAVYNFLIKQVKENLIQSLVNYQLL